MYVYRSGLLGLQHNINRLYAKRSQINNLSDYPRFPRNLIFTESQWILVGLPIWGS